MVHSFKKIDWSTVNASALQFYFSMWQNGMLHQRFICSLLLCRKLWGENIKPLDRIPRSLHGFNFRMIFSTELITFDNSVATTPTNRRSFIWSTEIAKRWMNLSVDWHRTHRKIKWIDWIWAGIRGEYLRVIAPAPDRHMRNMFFFLFENHTQTV